MTVRCPQCSTRYRLPPRSQLGRNPTYRCTRCRHVFAPDEEAEAPAVDEWDEPSVHDDDEDDAPVFTIGRSRPELDDEADNDEAHNDEADDDAPARRRRAAEVPRRGESSSPLRFATRTAITIALGYGILSIYLHTHPERTRDLFATIPLVGDRMAETRLHPGDIQLVAVRGDYKRVHGDRLVFVISGTAINNAPVPVASIQVQGRILGPDEQRQVVYAGAAPQDVIELGTREIDLLQTLKPSSDWVLRPGEQDRFLVVFVDPPTTLTEFVAEVVVVRGINGRALGPLAKRR